MPHKYNQIQNMFIDQSEINVYLQHLQSHAPYIMATSSMARSEC